MTEPSKSVSLIIISIALLVSIASTFSILIQTSKITKVPQSSAEEADGGAVTLGVVQLPKTIEQSSATVGLVVYSQGK